MSNVLPDEDELYRRLLPVFRQNVNGHNSPLYQAFSKYWDAGKDYSAGEAMQKALMESGIIPEDISSSMQDAAQEYEDAMAGMEIMKNAL